MKETIYTHDEASRIVELFEEVLCEYDIVVPSPEDDDREEDNAAVLYGSVYSDLLDEVEEIIIGLLSKVNERTTIIPYEYSGNW